MNMFLGKRINAQWQIQIFLVDTPMWKYILKNPSALRSKKILTETLLRLMKQYPYHEITVKHIILESGVSRKTFYRNFLSKDDILNSHIDTILYQYFEALKVQGEICYGDAAAYLSDIGLNQRNPVIIVLI